MGNKPIKEKLNARLMHALRKLTYVERFLRDNEFVKYQFIIKCHFQQYIQVDDLFEKKKECDPHSNSLASHAYSSSVHACKNATERK